ncbi:MAG: hypothetical protein [Microvirus sp.]|nr:MAG: hypothetical protein [Microvirus sp.]
MGKQMGKYINLKAKKIGKMRSFYRSNRGKSARTQAYAGRKYR